MSIRTTTKPVSLPRPLNVSSPKNAAKPAAAPPQKQSIKDSFEAAKPREQAMERTRARNQETYGEKIDRNREIFGRTSGGAKAFAGESTTGTTDVSFDHRGQDPGNSDGYIVGANGRAYPPGTSPSDVPAVEPSSGRSDETIIYVNGQGTTPEGLANDLQDIADATNANVVAVYNATSGSTVGDTTQSLLDKFGIDNPATESATDLIYNQLKNGEDVHLVAHSQGAIIVSEAISEVRDRLQDEGYSNEAIHEALGNITVETFGGASQTYPDGPKYVHYLNQADFVPRELGLGEVGGDPDDLTPREVGVNSHPGVNATVVQFNEGTQEDRESPGGNDHSLGTYLKHYEALDEVESSPDRVDIPNRTEVEAVEDIAVDVVTGPWNPYGGLFGAAINIFG